MDAAFIKAFGAVIKKQRERYLLTQQQLADRARIHRTYISDIERGSRNVSINSIKRIADALGTPVSLLFAEAETGLVALKKD
ncbi:MAG TPA: helix-turn-helix transcriptional regulator [Verrucomicrobiae bacterium]|nr:helix-turn-helix transcriptional regulator [Verrucomicrobiae bacterium]